MATAGTGEGRRGQPVAGGRAAGGARPWPLLAARASRERTSGWRGRARRGQSEGKWDQGGAARPGWQGQEVARGRWRAGAPAASGERHSSARQREEQGEGKTGTRL